MKLPKEKIQILNQTFEIDLPKDTFITMESLIEAISGQSALLCYYGELKNLAAYNAQLVRADHDKFTSQVRQEIKSNTVSSKRITVEEANDILNQVPDIIKLKQKLIEAEYLEERTSSWYYSIKERGQMLNSLAAAYRAELSLSR